MSNLKIAFFLPNLAGGGAETFTLRLAKFLSEEGCSVDIVLMRREGQLLGMVPQGVRLIDLDARLPGDIKPGSGLLAILRLASYIRKQNPTVLLAVMNYSGILALLARRLASKITPVIVNEQTTMSRQAQNAEWFVGARMPFFARLLYPKADAIVAASIGVAEDLSRITKIPRERIRVIYNPTDPEIGQKAQEPVDHPWFIDGQLPIVLGVGRLVFQKDFETLIKAFALVRQSRPARLVILGEGKERPRLEALVRQLKLENDVSMPGFEPNPFKFMSRASVFVLSSRFEGFGMVIAEALACGCPVVSTDCLSGPSEILENGKWGKLVPVGDVETLAEAILETIENPPDREKLKQRGMDFHIDKIGQQWLEVIHEVAKMQAER